MYENLKNSKIISLDIETYDPELTKYGPGVYRSKPLDFQNSNGYILGVAIGDEHGTKAYYNLGHYDCLPETREKNIAYLKETLEIDSLKLGQNLMYDLDWLENWCGIKVNGKLIDVGIAEALLDENQGKYNLDFMGKKYFNEGKKVDALERFCNDNNLKGDVRKWLWKVPSTMATDYVIQDIDLPLKIWNIQEPELHKQELFDLFRLECDLLRVLLKMRKTGVKIDTAKREKNAHELELRIAQFVNKLTEQVGFAFNFRATRHMAFIFDQFDISYPTTEKGNASVTRDILLDLANGLVCDSKGERITDEVRLKLGADLADLRRADKVLNTFVHGSLVNYVTDDGLIHCSFYPMRTDDFGTRSGRFSSANPNLQQIPSIGVDEYYGRISREPFVPFDNCWWGKLDYSQIEYRFMAHFARGKGADEVRAAYQANPRTDYHQYIQDLTGLKRRYAKNLNFGVAYGMGARHMAEFFHWELQYCYDVMEVYHSHAPFIKSTIRAVEDISKRRGYIKTFLKRRSRLIDDNKAYTMFCRLTQGSAADLMKQAMHKINEAGIFDVLPPHITVHDELDLSIPKTKEGIEAFIEAKHIMEHCVELKVPIIADMEIGYDWAILEEIEEPARLYEMLKEV